MKIFGIEFNANGSGARTSPQAFNTPFLKVGKGNLSLPFVQSRWSSTGVIYFGQDNLFPQLLNQMYFTSPLHGSIVDFTTNAVMGGGIDVQPVEDSAKNNIDVRVFMRKNKLNSMFKVLCRDFYLHRRIHILMNFSDSGKFLKMTRIDPSKIRYNFDGSFEYSDDWANGRKRRQIEPYNPAGNYGEVLYTMQDDAPGQDFYPIPTYSSALNWCFLDGEMSFLHKNNIQQSIFPSVFIRRPKRFGSKEEQQSFIDGLKGNEGAENAGKVGVLTGDGFENTPEVVNAPTNQNDKLFTETAKELKDSICFAHKINPSIMGIKVAGSLGNAQELEMSYGIWEKNVVFPLRDIMENLGQTLCQITDTKGKFQVNGYQIIGDVIVEGDNSQVNQTAEILSAMSPLLANKILESLTLNEVRAMANLPRVDGGDTVASLVEDETEASEFAQELISKVNN